MHLRRIAIALALTISTPAMAETLTNDTIVSLSTIGLGDAAIIAKIKASPVAFELSTDQMIALKGKGVSGPVIAAMIEAANPAPKAAAMAPDSPDPMAPHPSGVYLLVDDAGSAPHMTRIDATVSNQAKTGGILGYALTSGIASMSIKASIQNETARARTSNGMPAFYLFFDESNGDANRVSTAWLAGTAATVSSPSELTLIKLNAKSGHREARVGSMNIGGAKTGVMDSDRIPFGYEQIRAGVYKVKANAKLAPGEYGFIYSISGGGGGGALTARIFDFSIAGPTGGTHATSR